MGTHPKNTEYVRRWRLKHRDEYGKQNIKDVSKYYFYKRGVKELMRIDLSLFL